MRKVSYHSENSKILKILILTIKIA